MLVILVCGVVLRFHLPSVSNGGGWRVLYIVIRVYIFLLPFYVLFVYLYGFLYGLVVHASYVLVCGCPVPPFR